MNRIRVSEAYQFCNWLNEREGLPAPYEPLDGAKQSGFNNGRFIQPDLPWAVLETTSSYRLPTLDQYTLVCQAGYQTGVPWQHANDIEFAQDPRIFQYKSVPPMSPLYSIQPNRNGLFVNDRSGGTILQGTIHKSWGYPGRYGIHASLFVPEVKMPNTTIFFIQENDAPSN